MNRMVVALLMSALLLGGLAAGQEDKPQEKQPERVSRPETAGALYRVAVSVNEMDGDTKVNSRAYTVMVRPLASGQPHNGQLRVGSRVPVQSGNQTQYMDVGMKIDVLVPREVEGLFTGTLSIEMNTVVPGELQGGNPVLRDLRLHAPFVLQPGKPAVVGTVDDVNSKRTFQVEVTATKLR